MAIKPGWSSPLDERFGFGGGSENSPFEVERFLIGVEFMVKKIKRKLFCFYKIKDTDTRTN